MDVERCERCEREMPEERGAGWYRLGGRVWCPAHPPNGEQFALSLGIE
jgi:hypothetical protein